MGNGSAFDVLVRPDTISRVSRFLRERHVNFDVIIPDVQQAIDQENPPLPPELIDELEGRAGSCSFTFKIYSSLIEICTCLRLLLTIKYTFEIELHLKKDFIILYYYFIFHDFRSA